MKLYLINQYEAQMANECGINVVREEPVNTMYEKSEILQTADVELPEGYTVEDMGDGRTEIFNGSESVELVTEQDEDGKYVTSLVSSDGIVQIKTWSDEYTYDVEFNNEENTNSKGWRSSLDECKDYIEMYNGTNESYFEDYKGGTVSIRCNETGEVVFETEIKDGKYEVYYCTPVENVIDTIYPDNKEAKFNSLEDAMFYVENQTRNETPVNPSDTDNGNNRHWYEIYFGDPVDEEGNLKAPLFETNAFYNK